MIRDMLQQVRAVRQALEDHINAKSLESASMQLEAATTMLDALIAELEMFCDK